VWFPTCRGPGMSGSAPASCPSLRGSWRRNDTRSVSTRAPQGRAMRQDPSAVSPNCVRGQSQSPAQ
jgi:hypothetical protein